MSSKKSVDILREKLILSDIEEIQLHGLRDFSLRKAATCCDLSSLHAISTSEIKMTSSPQPLIYLCAMERHPVKDAGEPHTTTRECILGICVAYIQFPVETPHSRFSSIATKRICVRSRKIWKVCVAWPIMSSTCPNRIHKKAPHRFGRALFKLSVIQMASPQKRPRHFHFTIPFRLRQDPLSSRSSPHCQSLEAMSENTCSLPCSFRISCRILG